ncbi:hypothetical protein [Paludisphaera rhizosphaerae]|uniref:hypothetical protein n=1 Tax=Paludisphaera rhizosphaerae TaxID=2711216 RepID=UPI0013EC677C|nr:hypothetical protein [Paludisphaera rhizosphaerae]
MFRIAEMIAVGRLAGAVALLAGIAGCGGGSGTPQSGGPTASHGGLLQPLPNSSGLVELAFEPVDPAAKGAKAKGRIVAYFSNPNGDGPPTASVSEVAFTDASGKPVALAEKASAGTGARYESPELTLPSAAELHGKLAGKIGGESFEVVNRPR